VKIECQVNEQNQGSKVDLNVKVEFVEKTSTLKNLDKNYRSNL
jgi:hypothetical protein